MTRRLVLGVVLLIATAGMVSGEAAVPWSPRPATFGVAVTKDVPIVASDGTVLSADVYRPAAPDGSPAPGRFPTLVVQTPYNKDQLDPHSDFLVQRGYVDVVVDVRGTGSSGGTFNSFDAPQQQDGKDVVDWAAAQPWSTGRVGLHGTSYYAINQLLTAALQPPALKAIFPVVPTGDNYRTTVPGGRLTSLAAFSLLYATNGTTPPGYTGSDPVRAAGTVATRPGNVLGAANYSATTAAGGDGAYDGPYYRNMSPLWKIGRIKTPTFLVGGWYDALSQRDAPLLFTELQRRRVPVKLVMGPWHHTTPGQGLPADGLPTLEEMQLRWFDRYVRGAADPGLAMVPPSATTAWGRGGSTPRDPGPCPASGGPPSR